MYLNTFLKRKGYIQIPLSRSGVGHFHTQGLLNGRQISVLIDTGASNTVFSLALIEEMGLSMTKLAAQGGGAGSSKMDIYQIKGVNFVVGGFSPKFESLFAIDFSHVNQALQNKNESSVDSVLGADILEAHSAVIDYASKSCYLKLLT